MSHEASLSRLLHATCVDIEGRGVLIQGRSGAGKSDLALRLIDQPGRGLAGTAARLAVLVADDQVIVRSAGGRLVAEAPDRLKGLLEIRGLGILKLPYRRSSTLHLLVTLSPEAEIERLPEPSDLVGEILDVKCPHIRLDPGRASAPARVRAALDALSVHEPGVISTARY
ncbi:MAG TPA: HPr kinase/phosphatase C-terminal domain-containing protein [Aestuariivirgaceae bacterium]|jgi:serine kinase of HPr protein (carbohydrate metabolism regulator)